jgi:hypothetical protein
MLGGENLTTPSNTTVADVDDDERPLRVSETFGF